MTTRNEILKASKRLFNNDGYSNISMRDISGVCNISVGNLTYHFNHKIDIITEIINDSLDEMSYDQDVNNIEEFFDYLNELVKVFNNNRFYFNEFVLFKNEPAISKNYDKTLKIISSNIKNHLNTLNTNKYLVKGIDEVTIDGLVTTILLVLTSWVNGSNINSVCKVKTKKDFNKYLLTLLNPYLAISNK